MALSNHLYHDQRVREKCRNREREAYCSSVAARTRVLERLSNDSPGLCARPEPTSSRLNRFTELRDFRTVKYWLADVSIDILTFFITWLAIREAEVLVKSLRRQWPFSNGVS